MPDSTQPMLETALRINASYGSVLPLGKDKRPLIEWARLQTIKATEEEIRGWFECWPEAQLGLITGRASRCIVVDVDVKSEGKGDWSVLPQNTTIIQTGSGGRHYYYQYYPIGNKASILPHIDIRGDGGYVVIPPSVMEKGAYTVLQDFPYAPFPHELFDGTGKTKELEPRKRETWDVLDYEGYGEGQRNHRMAEYIGKVLVKLSPDIWEEIGYKWVQSQNKKNTPPLSEHELRATFLSIAKAEAVRLGTGEAKRFHNRVAPGETVAEFCITSTKELMTMDIPPFPYVVDRMIPKRAITAITADSGKGKSMVAWILATYIARGEPVFDKYRTEQQSILYVDQEMDRDLIADRYRSIAKEELPMQFMIEQSWNITDDDHFAWMVNHIKANRITMVVFDTLTTIHDKEENSASEMREVNKRLLGLIAETGVTVMYLHHHRKPTPGMPMSQSSSRGSTEIMAKIASHFTLEHTATNIEDHEDMAHKKTTKSFVLRQEKSRRPESIDALRFDITYDDLERKTTWTYMGEGDVLPDALQRAADAVMDYFHTNLLAGIVQTSVVVDRVTKKNPDISADSIRRALGYLSENKILAKGKGTGNSNSYSLPERQDIDL